MIADPSLADTAAAIATGSWPPRRPPAPTTWRRCRGPAPPGVYSDDFYARWRRAYDEAACAAAGGVASHDHQIIGRHQVEVTTCR